MSPSPASARLLSVNIGAAARLHIHERLSVLSGIGKRPVAGAVAVQPLGLAGDEQADPSVHGGLHKAVYAYPHEHMAFWLAERQAHGAGEAGEALPPGFVGENLTLCGLLEHQVWVGDTLHVEGSPCVLRVTAPREPCYKFNAVMGFALAARLMVQHARCGFYLSVVTPGTLRAGQALHLQPGPRGLRIDEAIRAKWAKHRR